MSTLQQTERLPRAPLVAIVALMLAALVATAAVRWSGASVREPDAAPVATRLLRFEDRPDGGVAVIDAKTNRVIDTMHGEQGFLRGTLRALARERRMREMGGAAPFELTARADGRLTLIDATTGARIDLESFGPTNAAVFARLLTLNKTEP